jgi:F-type H+-transporting ATPase subunit delta
MAELATIARPYAEAAFRLALEADGGLQRWSDTLAMLDTAVSDESLASRLGDPNVTDSALEGVILGALGERLDGQGRNFVQVLVQNGRLDLVSEIRAQYDELKREHEGVLEARIVSAMPIGDDEVRPLVSALEAKYKRRVNAHVEVDPELIGGARILVGDKVIDATVRGRLDAMRAALTH